MSIDASSAPLETAVKPKPPNASPICALCAVLSGESDNRATHREDESVRGELIVGQNVHNVTVQERNDPGCNTPSTGAASQALTGTTLNGLSRRILGPVVDKVVLRRIGRAVFAQVDLDAIVENMRIMKRLCRNKNAKVVGVLKGNAYGHGAVSVARHLLQNGVVDRLAVANIPEAIQLRKAGVDGIIHVLGNIQPWEMEDCVNYQLIPTVASEESIRELAVVVEEHRKTVVEKYRKLKNLEMELSNEMTQLKALIKFLRLECEHADTEEGSMVASGQALHAENIGNNTIELCLGILELPNEANQGVTGQQNFNSSDLETLGSIIPVNYSNTVLQQNQSMSDYQASNSAVVNILQNCHERNLAVEAEAMSYVALGANKVSTNKSKLGPTISETVNLLKNPDKMEASQELKQESISYNTEKQHQIRNIKCQQLELLSSICYNRLVALNCEIQQVQERIRLLLSLNHVPWNNRSVLDSSEMSKNLIKCDQNSVLGHQNVCSNIDIHVYRSNRVTETTPLLNNHSVTRESLKLEELEKCPRSDQQVLGIADSLRNADDRNANGIDTGSDVASRTAPLERSVCLSGTKIRKSQNFISDVWEGKREASAHELEVGTSINEYDLLPSTRDTFEPQLENWRYACGLPIGTLHIKVDTGMSRNGCQPSELDHLVQLCRSLDLPLEGIFTHICNYLDPEYSRFQMEKYEKCIEKYIEQGMLFHTSSSGAIICDIGTDMDMIRPGIAAFGIPPVPNLDEFLSLGFRPALSVKGTPTLVKLCSMGTKVGYRCTYTCPSDEWIGTFPIGYADGLWKDMGQLGRTQYVIRDLTGERCPIVGRISMDATTVRLPERPNPGELFTFISADFDPMTSITAIAEQARTLANEALIRMAPRLPRVYSTTTDPIHSVWSALDLDIVPDNCH